MEKFFRYANRNSKEVSFDLLDRQYLKKLDETEKRRTRAISDKWTPRNLKVEDICKSDEVRSKAVVQEASYFRSPLPHVSTILGVVVS